MRLCSYSRRGCHVCSTTCFLWEHVCRFFSTIFVHVVLKEDLIATIDLPLVRHAHRVSVATAERGPEAEYGDELH